MVRGHTVITRKGQITIPAEVRRALNLEIGDHITVTLEDGHARVEPSESVVARTAGSHQTGLPPRSAEQEREAIEQAWADEAVERMGG